MGSPKRPGQAPDAPWEEAAEVLCHDLDPERLEARQFLLDSPLCEPAADITRYAAVSLRPRRLVMDVSDQCLRDRDYRIGIADLESWEAQHGRSLDKAIVLLHTGFGRYWPDRRRYLGTDERGKDAIAKLHFPGLHPEAARWLATEAANRSFGIDLAILREAEHLPQTQAGRGAGRTPLMPACLSRACSPPHSLSESTW